MQIEVRVKFLWWRQSGVLAALIRVRVEFLWCVWFVLLVSMGCACSKAKTLKSLVRTVSVGACSSCHGKTP